MRPTYHKLRVLEVKQETHDACSISFDVPPDLRNTFAYKPGQHLQLHVPCGERAVPRCYSLTSIPFVTEPLRVTVKHMTDGRASGWLCKQLRAGAELDVLPPAGMFTPRSFDGDFLMFAGGSGITPVFSILRSVLAIGKGSVRLIYANRDERSVIFGDELARLSREHPQRLQIVHWLESLQGIPSQAQLGAFAGNSDVECFICGPAPFMDAASAALKERGVPSNRIHVERFVSLPDDADEHPPLPASPGAAPASMEVELDGAKHEVKVLPGQLLIEAMEDAGLSPPFSCRAGACAACMCHLEEGDVELAHNHVLSEDEINDGWILSCQATALSPRVRVNSPVMIRTASQAFAQAAVGYADRTAVVGEDGLEVSYAELDRQRVEAARALLALGIAHGDRIAIWAQNCMEWIVAGLAVHSVGAVLVPVNTRMRGPEAAYILEKSGARVLFCAGQFLGSHYPTLLGTQRPATLEHVVVLRDPQIGDFTWQQFLAEAAPIADAAVIERAAAVKPEDRMDIMFTSGTTGLPKGVVTHHEQNLRVITEWSSRMGLVPDDRYLIVNPFFHTFGYKVGWLGGLLAGLTVLPHAVFDAKAVMARITRDRVSVLPGPPTLFISLLNDADRSKHDLSSLRATITGAAAIAPTLIERIRAELGFKIVLTGYGLTETCGIVSLCDPADDAETIALTSGKAIPDTELRCDAATGEILVRGYNVMHGYLDDEQATREAIDADGWLHTGDIGVLDPRGYLKITDRLKDMYIAGGFNCYPAEIERVIAGHPSVAQVAIIGAPDERLGEVGKAYVVLRPQTTLDPDEFTAWCRERMANYKVPRYVEVVEALPTNASGKVMKFQLRGK